jgi:hypothetical protein
VLIVSITAKKHGLIVDKKILIIVVHSLDGDHLSLPLLPSVELRVELSRGLTKVQKKCTRLHRLSSTEYSLLPLNMIKTQKSRRCMKIRNTVVATNLRLTIAKNYEQTKTNRFG